MRSFVKGFAGSISFLTVLPAKAGELTNHRSMIATFPLAGFIIGALLAAASLALERFTAPLLTATLLVALSVVLTGGLHLDGLADTADGLASGFDKKRIIEVMNDHVNGSFAQIAIVLALVLKIALLSSFDHGLASSLLVAPVFARWSLVLTMCVSRYPDKEGLAKSFFDQADLLTLIVSGTLLLLLTIAFIPLRQVFIALAAVIVSSVALAKYFEYRIGGNTGDTLGAIVEINEIVAFFILLLVSV